VTSTTARETRSLHIVMVMPTYLPETFGGAEQQARKLSGELVRQGQRITILAPRLQSATPSHDTVNGVRIRRFKLSARPNFGGRYFLSFLMWCGYILTWLIYHRSKYQVVHVFHGRLHAVPAVLGAWLSRRPVLVKIGRGGDHFDLKLLSEKKLYGPFFARLVATLTTGFIANSREIAADLQTWRIPRTRVHTIANGVEIPDLPKARDRSRWAPRFVYLGRLDPEKKLDVLIGAIAQVAGDQPLHLDIVGDGALMDRLREQAADLGVAKRVTFWGRTDDVSPFLRKADYFVSASESEGMSNALLEAMSFGVVPLVALVSGVSDLVDDGENGFTCQSSEIADVANVVARAAGISASQWNAMSQAARARVEAHFGLPAIAQAHIALYRRLGLPV